MVIIEVSARPREGLTVRGRSLCREVQPPTPHRAGQWGHHAAGGTANRLSAGRTSVQLTSPFRRVWEGRPQQPNIPRLATEEARCTTHEAP